MLIELIDTENMVHKNKKVNVCMVSIQHKGYEYVIFTNRDRLSLDVYQGADAEVTSYNGQIPYKRSIFGWLRNTYITYKTWLYNVTVNRKAVKRLKEKIANL